MHYHLDAVGGVAGDMFAAAVFDLYPQWQTEFLSEFESSGLQTHAGLRVLEHSDGVLRGRRFEVSPRTESPVHRSFADIRVLLRDVHLESRVRERSLAIFELLAVAEADVHGVAVDAVVFHEVGAWDSIADIVAAAWLIERCGGTWSCAPLPMGSGRVATAHGDLPVPAPATALLLRDMPLFDDGIPGERITPTGAAIVKHLDPDFAPVRGVMRLRGNGMGFGTRKLPGISNVLRIMAFEAEKRERKDSHFAEQVAVCAFEVDDQTAEDLAVGLDHLRALTGVLDVSQSPVLGKKGRMAASVRVLAQPPHLDAVLREILLETTSLGVRWQLVNRYVLAREPVAAEVDGATVRLKRANRPDGQVSIKAEMADCAEASGGHEARQRRRRIAESGARSNNESEEFGRGER